MANATVHSRLVAGSVADVAQERRPSFTRKVRRGLWYMRVHHIPADGEGLEDCGLMAKPRSDVKAAIRYIANAAVQPEEGDR